MEGPNCPTLYNDILKIGQETEQPDAFKFGVQNGGLVPDRCVLPILFSFRCITWESFVDVKSAVVCTYI